MSEEEVEDKIHIMFFKNKQNDYIMLSLKLLPTIEISYENGEDYDPDYGCVISFSWLFWNLSFFRK